MLTELPMQVAKIITNEDFYMISAGIYILTMAFSVYVIYRAYRK